MSIAKQTIFKNRLFKDRRATLEHINITVSDPKATADKLRQIFGWTIRWAGPSQNRGYTVHLGTDRHYLALHQANAPGDQSRDHSNPLNHIGIVVDDLDATERRVRAMGYTPHDHGDYEPGRRFYFQDHDQIEYEVVSYRPQKSDFRKQVTRQLGLIARYGALMR